MSLVDFAAAALRRLPPETAHDASLALLRASPRALLPKSEPDAEALRVTVAGRAWPNPIGLAAGYDKNAVATAKLAGFGFGAVEIGTVTPRPQPGNPKPRLFRLTEDAALINRFGFNSEGLDAVAARLAARPPTSAVIGANVGANKDAQDRAQDYATGYARLAPLVDYVTVNISSPNTLGLRGLQERAELERLLGVAGEAKAAGPGTPLFLKVAPDLDAAAVEEMVEAVLAAGCVDAVIVSNTTIARPQSLRSAHAGETGGLSGRPLRPLAVEALRAFRRGFGEGMPLIGVGGVEDAAAAYERIRAGAVAVQLYSTLVYDGPGLVARMKSELLALVEADGFASAADAVGADA